MTQTTRISTTFSLLFLLSQNAQARTDVYTHFTLVDPEMQTEIANAYLVVREGRIVKVGSGRISVAAAHGANVHDMGGRYALAGFIDAHSHITLGPQQIEMHADGPSISFASGDAISQRYGKIALAYGVTTIRNPGGDTDANARYQQKIASREWVGPAMLSAGAIIEPPPFAPPYFAYPRTEAEWQAEAAHQAALGMKYFKLYSELTEEEIATGIRVAHQHGLKAIAHLNNVSWTRAAQLGIDGLEHALATSPDLLEPEQRATYIAESGPNSKFMYRWFELADYDAPRIQEMIRLVVSKKIALDLTLVVNEIIYNADDVNRAYPLDFRRYEDPKTLQSALTGLQLSTTGWTPDDFARARAVMPKVLELARRLYESGAAMMIGTDGHGGSWYYAQELKLHVQAGIPTWAVLRMATSQAADILGIGTHAGRIAPGFDADVAFLNQDPVKDVSNTRDVHAVLLKGRYLAASALLRDLENGQQ